MLWLMWLTIPNIYLIFKLPIVPDKLYLHIISDDILSGKFYILSLLLKISQYKKCFIHQKLTLSSYNR